MAKVNGPLLSLAAHGQIAHTLVLAQNRGQPYAKLYTPPRNPNTQGQQDQRSAYRTVVYRWTHGNLQSGVYTGWDFFIRFKCLRMSAYNAFVQNILRAYSQDSTASFVTERYNQASKTVRWVLKDVADMSTGSESGLFQIYAGMSPYELDFIGSKAIGDGDPAGEITYQIPGQVGERWYYSLYKEPSWRMGINYATLLA